MIAALLVASMLLFGAQFEPPTRSVILEPADAEELAALLADAEEAQGVCYGWRVRVIDADGGGSGVDTGSGAGVGIAPTSRCDRWMVFTANIHYTSAFSESPDTAEFFVESNVAGAPTSTDLRRIGISGGRLLSNDDDIAVIEATSALPLLAAERGIVEPLPLEANTEALPSGDRATGTPGSDWLRKNGFVIFFGVFFIFFGAVWAVVALMLPKWTKTPEEGVHAE